MCLLGKGPEKQKRADDSRDVLSTQQSTQASLELTCRKLLEEIKATLKAELQAELKAQLKADFGLKAQLKDYAAQAVEERILAITVAQHLDDQFQRVRDETMAAVQEELVWLDDSLTNQVDELREQEGDRTADMFQETGTALRHELEEFVHDAIQKAERRIRQRLQAKPLTVFA